MLTSWNRDKRGEIVVGSEETVGGGKTNTIRRLQTPKKCIKYDFRTTFQLLLLLLLYTVSRTHYHHHPGILSSNSVSLFKDLVPAPKIYNMEVDMVVLTYLFTTNWMPYSNSQTQHPSLLNTVYFAQFGYHRFVFTTNLQAFNLNQLLILEKYPVIRKNLARNSKYECSFDSMFIFGKVEP